MRRNDGNQPDDQPEQPGESVAPPQAQCSADGNRQASLLVVEDDLVSRHAFRRLLARHGYVVTAVENGEQAWQELAESEYDLLLTDNDMPLLSGIGLVERLRKNGVNVPVVLMTGLYLELQRENINSLQISAVLEKPVTLKELLAVLSGVLQAAGI